MEKNTCNNSARRMYSDGASVEDPLPGNCPSGRVWRGLRLAVAHDLVPDLSRNTEFQILKIDNAPASANNSLTRSPVAASTSANVRLPDKQLAEKELKFGHFRVRQVFSPFLRLGGRA
jgi:hypothetical protein